MINDKGRTTMPPSLIAVLSDVRSVHNVGSLFRTADGAGFAKIYLCGITPAPVDEFGRPRPDFVKVSLGAERSISWGKASSIVSLLRRLKKEGYFIIALEQNKKSVPYTSLPALMSHRGRVALVVGNEVGGLSPSVLRLSDAIAEIPMYGKKESLNVAVAFGIAAYKLREVFS